LTHSTAFLTAWKNTYPNQPMEGRKQVFVKLDGGAMQYAGIRKLLLQLGKKTGIQKNFGKTHLFRKSRITNMIDEGISESVVKECMWRSQRSTMMAHYLRLTENSIDKAILGDAVPRRQRTPATVKACPRCHAPCEGLEFCAKCGQDVDGPVVDVNNEISVLKEQIARLKQEKAEMEEGVEARITAKMAELLPQMLTENLRVHRYGQTCDADGNPVSYEVIAEPGHTREMHGQESVDILFRQDEQ
jgi:hypothetical protein